MKRAMTFAAYVGCWLIAVTLAGLAIKFGGQVPHAWNTSSEVDRQTLAMMLAGGLAAFGAAAFMARRLGQKLSA